jgi:hypothetical protein
MPACRALRCLKIRITRPVIRSQACSVFISSHVIRLISAQVRSPESLLTYCTTALLLLQQQHYSSSLPLRVCLCLYPQPLQPLNPSPTLAELLALCFIYICPPSSTLVRGSA